MPFKSKAQQRFMFATNPSKAKEWAKETPNIKALPEKKHPSVNPKGRKLDKKATALSSTFMRGFGDEITKTAGPSMGRLARALRFGERAAKPLAREGMHMGGAIKGLLFGGGAAAAGGALGLRKGKEKGYEKGTEDVIDVAQQARQLGRREGVMAYHQALQAKIRGEGGEGG